MRVILRGNEVKGISLARFLGGNAIGNVGIELSEPRSRAMT